MGKKKQSITPDTYIHDLRYATDWRERQAAAEALAKYGDDESFTALLAALRDDSEPGVRISAARAFAKRRDPRATEPLISAFRKAIGCGDAAHSEFDAYVQVLGRLKDTRAVAALIAGLSSDTPEVREKIRDILLNETGQDAIPLLVAALENPDYRILTAAASVLSRRGYKVTEPLLKALASPQPATRRGAAMALGDLKAKKAVQPLVAALKDEDIQVVQAAAQALGRVRDRKASDPLLSLLHSDQVPVRIAAVEALGSIQDPEALDPLIALLTDETLEEHAGRSVARYGPAAINPLIARVRGEDEIVRERAVKILAQIRPPGVGPLVTCLQDPDSHVRLAATRALGLIDFDWMAFKEEDWGKTIAAALEGLLPVITDKDQDVRKAAFLSLGTRGGILSRGRPFYHNHPLAGKVLDTLTGALSDEDSRVKAWASEALGLFGTDECVAPLREVLQDRDELARKAAADALKRITEQKAALSKYMRDKESVTKVTSAVVKYPYDPDTSGVKYLNQQDYRRSFRKERGPPKMSRASAPVPDVPLPSAHPDPTSAMDRPTDTVIETTAVDAAEPRYANITFFHDDRKTELAKGEPLVLDTRYCLEVAVGTKRTGVPSTDDRDKTIREPKRDHPVTIMVTAEGKDFDIEENVQTFILPPSGDTVNPACFWVQAKRETTDPKNLAKIHLRLYCDFFLLTKIIVYAYVVGTEDDPSISRLGLVKTISKEEETFEQGTPDMSSILPRDMNISIEKVEDTFLLRFIFFNNEKQKVEFPAPLQLNIHDLEDALMNVRTIWTDIAMSKTFCLQLAGDDDEYNENMRKLAVEGRQLWTMLFERERGSALYHIGDWLKSHPLPDDSKIQICIDKKASDFVFPWALLYDRELPKKDYDPPELWGFWGIRYCIEQRMEDLPRNRDKEESYNDKIPLRIRFLLWNQFPNAKDQENLFHNIADRSSGCIEIPEPIIDARDCYSMLENCDWHILYFYSHGHTRLRRTDVGPDYGMKLFLQYYEDHLKNEKNDPRYEIYKNLYETIKKDGYEVQRSWIELSSGKVYLDELYHLKDKVDLKKNPIVFLNMCESAQVIPTLSDSFIHFFLDRGAACVIGTECPMTVEFAHPFSEMFFEGLLRGDCVGKAALEASRHFIKDLKNPLGLAYTIYGSVTPTFKPPPIQRPT